MQPLLIVDDDDDLRATLAEILGAQGHAVQHFADAREALSALHGGLKPSLILLDLMMPLMNGWEFRAEQRKDPVLNAIPVLVITARTAGDLGRETLGDVEILKKPFTIFELNNAMERASGSVSDSSHGE
jgi:CheY-like chemotaxis protein